MVQSRKLSVVMFTDIMGYTAMMQKDENTGLELGQHYRNVLTRSAKEHGGEVLKLYGDGSLTVFDSIIGAIQCAKEVQIIFQQKPVVPLRMGIHLGDLSFEDNDVYGDGVNVASRLESISVPGSVIFSQRVKEELEHYPDINYISLGKFYLKNVSKPVEIFALEDSSLPIPTREDILNSPKVIKESSFLKRIPKWQMMAISLIVFSMLFWLLNQKSLFGTEQVGEKSIAVLPFLDLSQQGDQSWFCEGLTEQITSNLVRLKNLKVIARTSAMKFKGTKNTIAEIGDELNVNHILEGSVRKSDERIRITAQLIKVKDEFHLWEKDYDKPTSDFFEIQDEVSAAIADALKVQLSGQDKSEELSNKDKFSVSTKNLAALKNYQLGKHYYDMYDSWTYPDFKTSLDYFNAAIDADSNYAEAYIGKANLLLAVAWRKHVEPDSIKGTIQYSIEKAISLNPQLGSSYVAKGYLYYLYDFDFDRAEELYKKSIDLQPNCDVCYYRYFFLKFVLGEFDEARNLIEKAIELNPLNSGYHSLKGETYWAEKKYDAALAIYQENLEKFPNDLYSIWGMACTYGWSGEYEKAIDMINSIPGYTDRNFATAIFAALKGDTLYAKKILNLLLEEQKKNENSYTESWTWPIAAIYANLGEHDAALDWLEKGPIDFMYIADWFRPLREIPRFKILLKAHGFNSDLYVN